MMEWTDRHWRRFARTLTKRALLYTEMVTAKALIHGHLEQLTAHSAEEYPLALQIGGADPDDLFQAVHRTRDLGFCEINLNLGCPSDRVQSGAFGAALMKHPARVADCLDAMAQASGATGPEITAKIRLGVDDDDVTETLPQFLDMLDRAPIQRVIIHARKAILGGLSPKQNREVPPLDYSLVHAMKKQFQSLRIILNGGIESVEHGVALADGLDGFMLGRAAYQKPQTLLQIDPVVFNQAPPHTTPEDALLAYRPYVESVLHAGWPLKHVTRHLVGLYHDVPGARQYRRILSEQAHKRGADWSVIAAALHAVQDAHRPCQIH
jgi:tRNA-dihydrouridine synthase A